MYSNTYNHTISDVYSKRLILLILNVCLNALKMLAAVLGACDAQYVSEGGCV